MFRDDARAFAYDSMALTLAQEATARGTGRAWPVAHRVFMFLPYMHSESAVVHEAAVDLFSEPAMEDNLDFEYRHKAIIDRFGRYPHRNAVLGRRSSPQELAFLEEPGSRF